jgi:hypothetical protein
VVGDRLLGRGLFSVVAWRGGTARARRRGCGVALGEGGELGDGRSQDRLGADHAQRRVPVVGVGVAGDHNR